MVQRVDQVSGFLRFRPGKYFCDKCISLLTGIEPPNQVNQLTRGLGAAGTPFHRVEAKCSNCQEKRMATAYLLSNPI